MNEGGGVLELVWKHVVAAVLISSTHSISVFPGNKMNESVPILSWFKLLKAEFFFPFPFTFTDDDDDDDGSNNRGNNQPHELLWGAEKCMRVSSSPPSSLLLVWTSEFAHCVGAALSSSAFLWTIPILFINFSSKFDLIFWILTWNIYPLLYVLYLPTNHLTLKISDPYLLLHVLCMRSLATIELYNFHAYP